MKEFFEALCGLSPVIFGILAVGFYLAWDIKSAEVKRLKKDLAERIQKEETAFFDDQVLPKITSLAKGLHGGKMPATQANHLLKQFERLLKDAAIVEEDGISTWINWRGDIDWLERVNQELEEQGGEFHPKITILVTERRIYLNWTDLDRPFAEKINFV